LPGQGDPHQVRQCQEESVQRSDVAVEQRRRMRMGRRGQFTADTALPRQEFRTVAERLYYSVFKPAVQHIRRTYPDARDLFGRAVHCDYGLLKEVLPRMSQLRFEDWLQLRQKCGRPQP
ncbi:MAG: hypothetical protein GXY83_38485, partial [Rhodopirellula sp.]|nr:hypothetical protein [Rhodopirellula sp.]